MGNALSHNRMCYALLALGRNAPPGEIRVGNATYRHVQTVKHDFWALTAFYDDAGGRRVVYKEGRVASFHGLRLEWVGRLLARREARIYRKLGDLPNVPRLLGTVGKTAIVHAYVPGRTLDRHSRVPDGFFAELQRLMAEVHRRGIAYVDMNKRPNILIGEDGRPYLIDFQISWDTSDHALSRWWLRRLQGEDWYHILKHKRRLRPDEMTERERAAAERPSALIRLHRRVTRPYFLVRRALMRHLRDSGQVLPETTG
jgi:hypothetical protein